MEPTFSNYKIDGVIHFAGLKAVGVSVEKPLTYYYRNLVSTMFLAKMCQKHHVTVLFLVHLQPYMEKRGILFAETKAMSERILMDVANVTSVIVSNVN